MPRAAFTAGRGPEDPRGGGGLQLLGGLDSPYTNKMLAVLRFRRIAHRFILFSMPEAAGLPTAKGPRLAPTAVWSSTEATNDSTPMIRRLESMHRGRSIVPSAPAVAFFAELLEDWADECACPSFALRHGSFGPFPLSRVCSPVWPT